MTLHKDCRSIACPAFVALFSLGNGAPAAAQDIPDTSPEAIRAYADGAEAHLDNPQSEEALAHFRRAHALDPNFFTPVYMQYLIANNMSNDALADSLEAVLQQNRDRLSGYYQGMLDAFVLRRKDLFVASEEVARGVVERYPGTRAAYNYALFVWQRDPEAALRALEQLDPDREPMRGWFAYWTVRASVLHTLGDLHGALDNARQAQQRHPDRIAPVGWEALLHGALGDVERAEEALARASAMPGAAMGVGYRDAGQELLAHGYESEGRAMLESALAWFDNEDTRTSNTAAAQRAYTLYLLGRNAEARDAYRELAEAVPTSIGYAGSLAVNSALAGDPATAEAILEGVKAGEIGSDWQDRAGWQLLIHAALGDVAAAKRAMKTYGLRPLWLHRDPTLLRVLGNDSEYRRVIAAGR
jgi:tetratricopeptide (TPR) repeat protein